MPRHRRHGVVKLVRVKGSGGKIPFMRARKAANVEEALIRRFGLRKNGGRLRNERHEIDPKSKNYWRRVRRGERILDRYIGGDWRKFPKGRFP